MHTNSYKLMESAVNNWVGDKPNLEVLDLGSLDVNGTYRNIFNRSGWIYHGMDIVPGLNVDLVGFESIKKLYDLVISGQTLEHVGQPWEWILELKRYLKVGGILILIAPHTWHKHLYPLDCWRIFPDGMRALFDWAKLEVLEVKDDIPMRTVAGKTGGRLKVGDTLGVARYRVKPHSDQSIPK